MAGQNSPRDFLVASVKIRLPEKIWNGLNSQLVLTNRLSQCGHMVLHQARITGAALTPFSRRKDGSGFRDWAFDAFESALAMAELDPMDIDALFVASESDFFSMQLNPASVLATELGLCDVAVTRCEGGGASGQLAVHAAVNAVQNGTARHAVVIGVDPSASHLPADSVRRLYGLSFDIWTDGLTEVSPVALYALSFEAFRAGRDVEEGDLTHVTLQNRANACHNPNAHLPVEHSRSEIEASAFVSSPYRKLHCSPLSDGAAALVVSRAAQAPIARANAPRVAGIGAANDHMHLGARENPGLFSAKSCAMKKACDMAAIAPSDIGVAEVYDAYAGAQLQAIDALGFSDDVLVATRRGDFAPKGGCPINLSGGLMGQGAPVGATGVGQTATIALLLEGRYHAALQPENLPRYGLADTHGGICTLAATTILERGASL